MKCDRCEVDANLRSTDNGVPRSPGREDWSVAEGFEESLGKGVDCRDHELQSIFPRVYLPRMTGDGLK